MTTELYVGIDPGKKGGIVCLRRNGYVKAYTSMPETDLSTFLWLKEHCEYERCQFFIEHVHSMPKQGVKSTFTFGDGFGQLKMAAIAISRSYTLIDPREWRKGLGIKSGADKEELYLFSQELFPDFDWSETKDWNMAVCDALLIAEYARRTYE